MSILLLNPFISFGGQAAVTGTGAAQVLVTAAASGQPPDPDFASVLALLNFETSVLTNVAPSGFTFTSTLVALTADGAGKFGKGVHQPSGATGTHTFQGVNTDNWDFTTVDFTVEAWVYRENAVSKALFSHWRNASTQQAWWMGIDASGHLRVDFNAPVSTPLNIVDAGVMSTAAWDHVVFERAGSTFRLYKNGAMVGTKITGNSSSLAAVTNAADDFLRIGILAGAAIHFFDDDFPNQRMDEIRVTRGVARYNSDSGYTVPNQGFPVS